MKKGWTFKNMLLGIVFLFVGFVIWFLDSVVMGVHAGITETKANLGFWGAFGFDLMAFGALFFWLIIPAYQRWWQTKKLLALLFIVPTGLLFLTIFLVTAKGK